MADNLDLVTSSDPLHPSQLIPELCQLFYQLGWTTGTGGGVSIRVDNLVYIAPSGIQKERIIPLDLFVMELSTSRVLRAPPAPATPSSCTPLFFNSYRLRNAGACIHTHSPHAVLATLVYSGPTFTIRNQEMIKGIRQGTTGRGLQNHDTLVVPIIENAPREDQLTDAMAAAMAAHPDTCAVLVRRHGVFVWGATWEQTKVMTECYDYLFDMAVRMRHLGLDPAA
ncbi:Methylthioribulose-1-phosphate dehydratase [Tieghemiomyces parasiticus]|uniref:Methylthioribulose-1-phosphate dehydratase n=1 Tax=Tieghemiomyces parasiticus TaxID=78921 RepID=A0A9W8A5N9_9FUNG|nr:Methylthioribulose-1-phosphate dehydratase [Tieghemiomyces parasiticus]